MPIVAQLSACAQEELGKGVFPRGVANTSVQRRERTKMAQLRGVSAASGVSHPAALARASLLTPLFPPSSRQVVVTLSGYQNPKRGEMREAALALGGQWHELATLSPARAAPLVPMHCPCERSCSPLADPW